MCGELEGTAARINPPAAAGNVAGGHHQGAVNPLAAAGQRSWMVEHHWW